MTEEWGSRSTLGQQVLLNYVREGREIASSEGGVELNPKDIIEAMDLWLSPLNERLGRIENGLLEIQNLLQTDAEMRDPTDHL